MIISSDERTTPVTIGAPLPTGNIGKTETHGYELDIEYRKYFKTGIGISARFSAGYVHDKVIYKDDPEFMPAYQKKEDYPINQTRSYIDYGIIQNWDELYTSTSIIVNPVNMLPGEMKIIDFNGDGVVDTRDIIPFGYPARPEYNYSYNLSVSYKGFSVNALLYGVFNINYSQELPFFTELNTVAYPHNLEDMWSPEMNNTLNATDRGPKFLSKLDEPNGTYNYIVGSYLRLKNAEISYEIPKRIYEKAGLSNLRVYATGYNLLQWTKDEWREDREAPMGGGVNQPMSYPLMKRFTFGVTMGF
jgi:hypothetical protein